MPFSDDHRSQTEGPATKLPRHCEEGKARRTPGWPLLPLRGNSPSGNPFSFRSLRDRAARCAAGVTDCHALRARNDVVIWWPVLLFCSGGHRGERHGGRSLRSEFHTPSVSQRPVERAQWCDLTTGLPERIGTGTAGRAVLLDFRQAKSIRHEFVRGDSPHYMSKGSMPRTGWPFSDR